MHAACMYTYVDSHSTLALSFYGFIWFCRVRAEAAARAAPSIYVGGARIYIACVSRRRRCHWLVRGCKRHTHTGQCEHLIAVIQMRYYMTPVCVCAMECQRISL